MGRYKKKSGKYIPTSEHQCNFCNKNLIEDELITQNFFIWPKILNIQYKIIIIN